MDNMPNEIKEHLARLDDLGLEDMSVTYKTFRGKHMDEPIYEFIDKLIKTLKQALVDLEEVEFCFPDDDEASRIIGLQMNAAASTEDCIKETIKFLENI